MNQKKGGGRKVKYPDAESRQAALRGYADDIRRAEHAVAKAAAEYVDYFFPPTATGEGLETEGGQLIRAVRALKRVQARQV